MPFVIALLAAAAITGATPATDEPIRVPVRYTAGAERFYPDIAQRMEMDGWTKLVCLPQADATLRDCRVAAEGPMGARFGQAALRMAPYLRVAVEGKALDAVVNRPAQLTVVFQVPAAERFPARVRAPSTAVRDAARPFGAPLDGFAHVNCSASFAGGGPLTDCQSSFETPEGVGFGQAAVGLATSAYTSILKAAPRQVRISLSLSDPIGRYGASIQAKDDRSLTLVWPATVPADLVAQVKAASVAPATSILFNCGLDRTGSLSACTPEGEVSAAGLTAFQALLGQAVIERRVYFGVAWSSR